jgi:hypothetical protein
MYINKLQLSICCLLFILKLNGQTVKILHNHLGYETQAPKTAVVLANENDKVSTFYIKDYKTKKTIIKGQAKYIGKVDQWKDWHFWNFEFDEVNAVGTYYIECKVNNKLFTSFPFNIQDDILVRNTLSDVVYYFKGQRSSGLLDKADKNMRFATGRTDRVDVHGGWYDATGDYGKHLSHLTFSSYFNPQQVNLTVWSLLESYKSIVHQDNINYSQFKRRLLDEAMYGADFLTRMKIPNGSFYRSISAKGPKKLPEDRQIVPTVTGYRLVKDPNDARNDLEKGTKAIPKYDVSYRGGGGMSIAALAIASTFESSGAFSNAAYLQAAKEAFDFLEKNNLQLTNDGKENIVDDYCALMAATELYKATGAALYKTAATKRAIALKNRLIKNYSGHYYWRADDADRPFFHASDAGLPVVSLLKFIEIADETLKKEILTTIKLAFQSELHLTQKVNNPFGYARQYIQNIKGERRESFFFPHQTETSPWWQGENARLGSLATAARLAAKHFDTDITFQKELKAYAWNQLNWILGQNPFDACMLEGHGRNNVQYLFFNTYQYTNAPGGICNGITSGIENEHDIDLNRGYNETGKDFDWRWAEQWLPHAAWYLIAISTK